MKDSSAKSLSLSAPALLVITPLLILALPTKAQTGRGTAPSPGPKTSEALRLPSVRERQLKMDEIEREAARPRTKEEERLALSQIAEDFKRIQILNNKMMSTTMTAATPDYENVANTTAEIRKRANRIRNNLSLPNAVSEETEKKQGHKPLVDAAGMKAALLSLDSSVMSFIENPIFQNPNVMDVKQAAKAGRDLETIIESSGLINKDAERLSNISKKKP
jgi:hypothetical protein